MTNKEFKKIGRLRKSSPLTEEHKKNISNTHKKRGVGKWMKGRKLSNETREKMKGRPGYWTGKKRPPFSLETRKKMSLAQKGKKKNLITPINSRVRDSLEYKVWRTSVFERDDFTCQSCGEKGGKLQAHHIYNFSNQKHLRFDVDNGITLCIGCHIAFHLIWGKRNNTRTELFDFLYS